MKREKGGECGGERGVQGIREWGVDARGKEIMG